MRRVWSYFCVPFVVLASVLLMVVLYIAVGPSKANSMCNAMERGLRLFD